MSDPQAGAERLDEDELPEDLIPEKFIEPEDWDAGAGASEQGALADESGVGEDESDIGQEREGEQGPEDAAMHVERGNAVD